MMLNERFETLWNYYETKLCWLDLHIKRLLAARAQPGAEDPLDQLRGLVVTEEEVTQLLERVPFHSEGTDLFAEQITVLESRLETISAGQREHIPLLALADACSLSSFEQNCLFLCLAVELDRKYEKLYGYLLDDITCKWPTPDLAMQLFCRTPAEKVFAWSSFAQRSKLDRLLLFREEDAADWKGSWLSRPLKLDERMMLYLTKPDEDGKALPLWMARSIPEQTLDPLLIGWEIQERLQALLGALDADMERAVFHLHGPSGAGKKHQLLHAFHRIGRSMLVVDMQRLIREDGFAKGVAQLRREAQLQRAVLCFDHWEACLSEEEGIVRRQAALLEELEQFPGCLAFLSERQWKPGRFLQSRLWFEHELAVPGEAERKQLWEALKETMPVSAEVDFGQLAGKFKLTPGQIKGAAARARQLAWQRAGGLPPAEPGNGAKPVSGGDLKPAGSDIMPVAAVTLEILHEACMSRIRHSLGNHAVRLTPRYSWSDLVLPEEPLQLLKQACNQVAYRHIVFGDWGFDRKLSYGKGVSVLFAGPPGTGKTMSAEVIAKELRLDIFKVDLSQVISKYIGETEKNLQKIFAEAKAANAILFFDEADALFGKRSDVKDSHDKYANMETAYLLQKMEEYDGISILATNLLQNFDEAFMRRMTYVIKFPFPDPEYREKIWRCQFPPDTPQSSDIDFPFLAAKLHIAGGGIKNVVLSAAFLAAAEETAVGMRHLIIAARHELRKTGKLLLKEDLGEYAYYEL
ncbi:AAA family ATPase [Brevibacillus borstelensis]|uniref:AAA family ATPase n=1 Tax=Brevibacillus borstelensis TaxID=45462 RepID=UPI0030BE5ED5